MMEGQDYKFAELESTNIFIVRYGERAIDEWISGGFIAVGWSAALELDKEPDWDRFKAIIRNASEPDWPTMSEKSLALQASSAYQFIQNIRVGDLILVPTSGAFLAARVLSATYYDESGKKADSAWKHKVEWLSDEPVPRQSYCANSLQRRLKVRQTCVNVNGLRKEILEALSRKRPLSFVDVVMQRAFEPVATALLTSINDQQLEELIVQLAQAAGAKAERAPKNSRLAGDVDVIATYDLRIGTEESTIKVAYQVKQHDATTGIFGI